MSVYIVACDLRAAGKDYTQLWSSLGSVPNCHAEGPVWFIDVPQTAKQVRDQSSTVIDKNDVLFVGPLARGWAAWNVACAGWLNDPARRW